MHLKNIFFARFRLIKAEKLVIFATSINVGSGNYKTACKISSVPQLRFMLQTISYKPDWNWTEFR